jgi:hypothetical protein
MAKEPAWLFATRANNGTILDWAKKLSTKALGMI